MCKIVCSEKSKSEAVLIPSPVSGDSLRLEDEIGPWALDIYEWLGLVALQSPRILKADDVDPYLSRYQVSQDQTNTDATNLIMLSWRAFIPSVWVRSLLTIVR